MWIKIFCMFVKLHHYFLQNSDSIFNRHMKLFSLPFLDGKVVPENFLKEKILVNLSGGNNEVHGGYDR